MFITSNSFLCDNQFFYCKSENIKISSQSCSDKSNDTTDIPLGNSGLNRINYCNNNLIDELIKNMIYNYLDVIDELKESLPNNIIVNNIVIPCFYKLFIYLIFFIQYCTLSNYASDNKWVRNKDEIKNILSSDSVVVND